MDKNKIIEDLDFRNRCTQFGLDWMDFKILDNMILVATPKQNMYMLLDQNYNIIDFVQLVDDQFDHIKECYKDYQNPIVTRLSNATNTFTFRYLSIKQIHDISDRIFLNTNQNGWPREIAINGQWYQNCDSNLFLKQISYLKFIEEEINIYWKKVYQFKLYGFQVVSLTEYLNAIEQHIKLCIKENLAQSRQPAPILVLEYLGQIEYNSQPMYGLLFDVIELLLKFYGYRKKGAVSATIEKLSQEEENDTLNNSNCSSQMLKLLDVPFDKSDFEKSNSKRKIR